MINGYSNIFNGHTNSDHFEATIEINTFMETTYNSDFRGVNNEPQRTGVKFNDPSFINAAIEYGKIGFIRWPGGTPTNSFSWKLGMTDVEFTGQTQKELRRYYNQLYAGRYAEAKGFERISDFVEFLHETGTKVMILVNVFHETPDQVRDLAKYLYENRIPVIYFELGNEVSFYVSNSGNQQPVYKSGTDYLNRVKIFNDIIKEEYLGAKTVISMSNWQETTFDDDILNYSNPFWDAITTHRFRGNGPDAISAIIDANGYLDTWVQFLEENYVQKMNNPEIYIGEHGVSLGGILDNTQFGGIFVCESILRLVTHPNISYLAGYRQMNGVYTPADNNTMKLEDAYQKGASVDTKTLDFNPYYSTPSVSLKVLDEAVNNSRTVWDTQIIGGTVVEKPDHTTIPALFAQAFKGENGKNYLVITNKSDQIHDITIKMDGDNISAQMGIKYTASSDALITNTDQHPTNITIQSLASQNPVTIHPYSVTRIEWIRTTSPNIPQKPWLMNVDCQSSSVILKWQPSLNAAGYKVKYGTTSANYSNSIDVDDKTTYEIDNLPSGMNYYFVVTAYNESGESSISNEVQALLKSPPSPLLRRVYAYRYGKIAVEWQGVEGAIGYKVKFGTASGDYSKVIDAGNNLGYLISGLDNNTIYYFVITAYNGLGESVYSGELSTSTKAWLPLAPHDAQIVSESDNEIMIQWEKTFTNTYNKYFVDSNGWDVKLGAWTIVDNQNRGVSFYQSPFSGTGLTIFDQSAVGNYEGEAMIELIDQETNKNAYVYGVVARYVDNQNYYKFVYNINLKSFRIVKVENGLETVLISKTIEQILSEKNAKVLDLSRLLMYIRVEGDVIQGSINQLGPIVTTTDDTHSEGRFGFYTLNVKANYDWARIYRDNANSYIVFRSEDPYDNFMPIATGLTGTSFKDRELDPSITYYYRVKSENIHGESYFHSNVLRKN